MLNNYTIYTDGAYSASTNIGGLGILILKNSKIIQQYNKAYSNTTNNRMELRAVIIALNAVRKNINNLIIYTDSMYVIGCATKGWAKKKNTDLWKLYDIAFKKASSLCKNLKFEHVKGHNGDVYNEIVDKLAVRAKNNNFITI